MMLVDFAFPFPILFPALANSTEHYWETLRERRSLLAGDYTIKAWRESGLLYPSIVTGIVRTIKHDMITSKIGALPALELAAVEDRLREILAL